MVRRRWRRMPMEVRREVMRLAAAGLSEKQIMEQVDISGGIWCVLAPLGGVIRKEAFGGPSGVRLSVEERQELWLGLQSGRSLREIARRLGRAPSTISREVRANGGREGYRPHRAQAGLPQGEET